MDTKHQAWRSVYTNVTANPKHKHANGSATKPAAAASKPSSRQQHVEPTASAAPVAQQSAPAPGKSHINSSTTTRHSSLHSRGSSRPASTQAAARIRHFSSCSDSDSASPPNQVQVNAFKLSSPTQQSPDDTASRFASANGPTCINGNASGLTYNSSGARRLSSSQQQPKITTPQSLSPYLAPLPLTARRPRSPGCPRPASPLSGLSRAAKNSSTAATAATGKILAGGGIISRSSGSRPGTRSGGGNRKRPLKQQLDGGLAAFKIQVSYGPRPSAGSAAVSSSPAAAVGSAQRPATAVYETYSAVAALGGNAALGPVAVPAAVVPTADITAAAMAPVMGVEGDIEACCDVEGEAAEEGLGMMLSEYILQMHTTPIACNSVSGLGDESDWEEDDMSNSKQHHEATDSSILAPWGLPAATVVPAVPMHMDPLEQQYSQDSSIAHSQPFEPDCSDDGMDAADSPSPTAKAQYASAAQMLPVSSPFAAAAAVEIQQLLADPAATCTDAALLAQDTWQGAREDSCNDSSGFVEVAVAEDFGFAPTDCAPYADIVGSCSSSNSISEDLLVQEQHKHDALNGNTVSGPSSAAAPAPAALQIGAAGSSGPALGSCRPQSSAGKRGGALRSTSFSKELPAGRTPSGLFIVSANSLDLRPAAASNALRSNNSRALGEPGSAALGFGSHRPIGSPQQRSFTDLDSSSEGFVKETSLGHLSASLFTPSSADMGMRMPLQQLWGSCETLATSSSAQSSFSSNSFARQQESQPLQQPCDESGLGAQHAGQSSVWQQQQQRRSAGEQKVLSSTRTRPQSAAGFLQRLAGSSDTLSEAGLQQPMAPAMLPVSGRPSSSGGAAAGALTASCAMQCCSSAKASGRPSQFGSLVAQGWQLSRGDPQASSRISAELETDVLSGSAEATGAAVAARDPQAPSWSQIVSGAAPHGVCLHQSGSQFVMQAWGAASATARPASGTLQRRNSSCSQLQGNTAVEDAATDEGVQQNWAVTTNCWKVKQMPVSNAADADARPKRTSSALADSVVRGCSELLLQQSWTDSASLQQQVQNRPPSRQRPPSEALHLFTNFL